MAPSAPEPGRDCFLPDGNMHICLQGCVKTMSGSIQEAVDPKHATTTPTGKLVLKLHRNSKVLRHVSSCLRVSEIDMICVSATYLPYPYRRRCALRERGRLGRGRNSRNIYVRRGSVHDNLRFVHRPAVPRGSLGSLRCSGTRVCSLLRKQLISSLCSKGCSAAASQLRSPKKTARSADFQLHHLASGI